MLSDLRFLQQVRFFEWNCVGKWVIFFASLCWLRDFLLKNLELKINSQIWGFESVIFWSKFHFFWDLNCSGSINYLNSVLHLQPDFFINMIHISFNQLNECVYNDYERICSCYGPNKRLLKFPEKIIEVWSWFCYPHGNNNLGNVSVV